MGRLSLLFPVRDIVRGAERAPLIGSSISNSERPLSLFKLVFSEELSMKKPVPHDKYFLKSLHEEIDLYDRKLAHLEKFGEFASTADRKDAENKLLAKRATLAATARQLADDGVEFSPSDFPRSFRAPADTTVEG
jgi:hypothetical protein